MGGKRLYDAHTRQILLQGGGHEAFCLVRFGEGFHHVEEESDRGKGNDGNQRHGDQGIGPIHGGHDAQDDDHLEDCREGVDELAANESHDGFNVGRATLDDITGLRFHVIIEREPVQMVVKAVTHPACGSFRCHGAPFATTKQAQALEAGQTDEQNQQAPEIAPDPGDARFPADDRQQPARQFHRFSTEDGVQRCANDQRDEGCK